MCSNPSSEAPIKEETLEEHCTKRKELVLNTINANIREKNFDGYKFIDMELSDNTDVCRHDYIFVDYRIPHEKLRKEHAYYTISVELTNHAEINGETVEVNPTIVSVNTSFSKK
jgi:hypothetical protein